MLRDEIGEIDAGKDRVGSRLEGKYEQLINKICINIEKES